MHQIRKKTQLCCRCVFTVSFPFLTRSSLFAKACSKGYCSSPQHTSARQVSRKANIDRHCKCLGTAYISEIAVCACKLLDCSALLRCSIHQNLFPRLKLLLLHHIACASIPKLHKLPRHCFILVRTNSPATSPTLRTRQRTVPMQICRHTSVACS